MRHRTRIMVTLNHNSAVGNLIDRYLRLFIKHHPQLSQSKAIQLVILKYLAHDSPTYHSPVSYSQYNLLVHTYHVLKDQLNHFQLVSDRNSYNLALIAHNQGKASQNIPELIQNQKDLDQHLKLLTEQLKQLNEIILKKHSKTRTSVTEKE